MKVLALLVVAVIATGCGDSPLDPSQPEVSLGVKVVTNSGRPLIDEPVALMGRPGLTGVEFQTQRTDAQGIASWRVESGQRYPMLIRGAIRFSDVVVMNDSQWLVSLPD